MRISISNMFGIAILVAAMPSNLAAQTYAERIVTGFNNPMFGTFAPGDVNRLFVGRIWAGRIEIVDLATRTVLPDPFLTITDLPNPLRVEQGLLGLTFDPDYATNGYFYVDYTGADNSINVVRYRVLGDPATSNVADPASAHTILNVPKGTWFWHNAGWIDFGPKDGYLYVNIGDPGSAMAQDLTDNLHGKILRIDVHGDDFPADPSRNYSIPLTNPFVGKEGDDEIWAYGLRNPWRASFDRLTGDLWINDTGESAREEVNFQPADSVGGENYGWPRREGSITGPPAHGGPLLPQYVEPVYDYAHDDPDPLFQGSVIAASGFYRGPVDAFHGHYFFTDNGSRNIWKLDPDAVDPRASVTNVKSLLVPNIGVLNRVVSFGEDAVGNLYLMDYDNAPNGDVFRIATASKDAIWNGNNASAGNAGDGTSWGLGDNWTRDGVADAAFVAEDSVVFAAGSSQTIVELGADRTVAAITFQASYWLQSNTLTVVSGNVFVEEGVTATMDLTLSAETVNHSIRKLGSGTLLVNGSTGQTVVKEGTLGGSGVLEHLTVRSEGTVAPGTSIGVFTIGNSFTMHAGSALEIELNGTNNSNLQNPQFDQILVGGAFQAAGTLDVVLFDEGGGQFVPVDGDSFTIVSTADGISGSFSQVNLPTLNIGLLWEIDPTDGKSLVISATSALRSDFNGNGEVDAADYVLWRNLEGHAGVGLAADGTGPGGTPDGIVNDWDYNFWLANFGTSVHAAGTQQLPGVPEPGAALMFVFGGIMWLVVRPRCPGRSRNEARLE